MENSTKKSKQEIRVSTFHLKNHRKQTVKSMHLTALDRPVLYTYRTRLVSSSTPTRPDSSRPLDVLDPTSPAQLTIRIRHPLRH